MARIDFKKSLKHLYHAPKTPVEVDVPEMSFLMVDGKGDPNSSEEFQTAIKALYGLSYTLRAMVKGTLDYVVMPLEGLWWAEDMAAFTEGKRTDWRWTLMIMQPEVITQEMVEEAMAKVAKKGTLVPASTRLERFHEGLAAQVMHIGPYSAEGPAIAALHEFIAAQGRALRGRHHEIYLSDPSRTAPEKMRTLIRQPMG
ncbi:MAG: hypothetical protein GX182_05695 [Firmicutes bacterium]|jgi:hypothetical protein|nr:hypothetical protein [Bacillota bacterium]